MDAKLIYDKANKSYQLEYKLAKKFEYLMAFPERIIGLAERCKREIEQSESLDLDEIKKRYTRLKFEEMGKSRNAQKAIAVDAKAEIEAAKTTLHEARLAVIDSCAKMVQATELLAKVLKTYS